MQIEQAETLWGPMYVFGNDTGVSQALRDFGEYGAVEVATYLRLLEPGDVFIDVGANIGTISRAIASAGRNLTVIGFEPQPEFHRLACANLIGCERAAVYPLAVSDRAGEIRINEVDLRQVGNYGHREIEGQRPSRRMVPCPAIRLDEFLVPRAPRPRLVKIDVEGMEAAVLRGLSGLVHERLVLSVEADRPENVPAILDQLPEFALFAAFFRMIRSANPKFDPENKDCRSRHVQLLGFAGEPPEWIHSPGYWPVRRIEDFEAAWARHIAI
ncbi:MAG: FkbM family methyltransferase [Thalassobaculum sp.]|uniref:FkbM family methyltransferase n=1 Tax=Thalassobaculum sp. TaxID=2022740 RepID=UPI0032EBB7AD